MLLYRTTWLNARWLVDNSGFRLHSKRTTVPAPLSVGLIGEWRQNGGICGHYHCVALALDLLVVQAPVRTFTAYSTLAVYTANACLTLLL